jgi:16S rRNA (adenine1518-N6/adenine1519-N6)-dimethyltransferase
VSYEDPEATSHRARKRFGQNFLHDGNIIRRIVAGIRPQAGETLLEIGPGQGALTGALLASGCELIAVELDRDLVAMLQGRFGAEPRFQLHSGDALKVQLADLAGARRVRVVGNLPYNISTPLIFHLLAQSAGIVDMHFMLQKEVVDRLAAGPGSKAYGRLGIMTQYHCRVEPLLDVPPGAFSPQPKVQSAVVRLVPHAVPPCPATSVETLQTVVRTAFNQRRKTLRNALQGLVSADRMQQLGIDPGARPETLSLQAYVALANAISADPASSAHVIEADTIEGES